MYRVHFHFECFIFLAISRLIFTSNPTWSEETVCSSSRNCSDAELLLLRERARSMFYHAYDGYMKYAYPYDELRPITCDGHDTWGKFSLTLIDSLDTLVVLGNFTEFKRVSRLVVENANFDIDVNVSVFETNIRVVGGLLSAHLLSHKAGVDLEDGWPCSGPLLRMAETVARKLIPAFNTSTGMPYGTVNLRHGVPKGETTVTCTACIGTYILEFATLSRLTGDPEFERVARRALDGLWKCKSDINMVGNHVDVENCKWTAVDMGVGAGVDSYLEYLVKGSILLDDPSLLEQFKIYEKSIDAYLRQDDWYVMASMKRGSVTFPAFTSLDAYWPGLLSLLGDFDKATKTFHNYYQVWEQFGALPEFYGIGNAEPVKGREVFPLRPELIESAMYLYRATKDPFYHCVGIQILNSIELISKTECGYATVHDVRNHVLANRMESFFLAETVKYLYLLFDPDNFMHNDGKKGTVIETTNGHCVIDTGFYVYNTEAHPIDGAAVRCCSTKKRDDAQIQEIVDSINLLEMFGILEGSDSDDEFWRSLQYDPGEFSDVSVSDAMNKTTKAGYESLHCPSRPFHARLSLDGETFDEV